MEDKPYVGDIDTIIEVGFKKKGLTLEDISLATLVELHIKKAGSGDLVKWTGAVYNTNYIRYTVIEGDFDQSGVYLVNPYLEIGGWKGCGETVSFYVYKKYT